MISMIEINKADASFRILSTEKPVEDIQTLCSLDHIEKGGMVFIKNKQYYKLLMDKYGTDETIQDLGIVFQDSFFTAASAEGQLKDLTQFRFYATVKNVDLALSNLSKLFFDELLLKWNDLEDGRTTGTTKVHASSAIAPNVFLGENVTIAAGVTIHAGCVILSNSTIGENTVLYPNVTIYRNVTIGKDCRVHGNTTIGSDGYGYNYYEGKHLKVWHFGGVRIGHSVEIGSGTSIDQGTFSPTIIGDETKIDNQVHLAHNCTIGKGALITGQAGFSGSVTIGDYVAMGGCAQFAPGIVIGNYAQIGGLAGVTSDVPEKAVFCGHPARPIKEWLKSVATLRGLSKKQAKKDQ